MMISGCLFIFRLVSLVINDLVLVVLILKDFMIVRWFWWFSLDRIVYMVVWYCLWLIFCLKLCGLVVKVILLLMKIGVVSVL